MFTILGILLKSRTIINNHMGRGKGETFEKHSDLDNALRHICSSFGLPPIKKERNAIKTQIIAALSELKDKRYLGGWGVSERAEGSVAIRYIDGKKVDQWAIFYDFRGIIKVVREKTSKIVIESAGAPTSGDVPASTEKADSNPRSSLEEIFAVIFEDLGITDDSEKERLFAVIQEHFGKLKYSWSFEIQKTQNWPILRLIGYKKDKIVTRHLIPIRETLVKERKLDGEKLEEELSKLPPDLIRSMDNRGTTEYFLMKRRYDFSLPEKADSDRSFGNGFTNQAF